MWKLIAKVDFFSALDEKILKKIADACIVRQFTRNETIVRQGEMGHGLYVISKGRVKVDREHGGVRLQVAELGPEQFFDEMSLIGIKPRLATVTGVEDSECLLLTRDSFVKLMNKCPEIPIQVARVLAERLQEADAKLASAPAPSSTAGAPAAARNGSAPTTSPADAKARIHNKVIETFQNLYTLKALSRFSVAVLGCPVEGLAANIVQTIRVGHVKAMIFPADEPVDMRIAARRPCCFSLHVFTASTAAPHYFGPVIVDPADNVHMTLRAGAVTLRNGELEIPSLNQDFLASYSEVEPT